MLSSILTTLGFSEKEASVYLATIRGGNTLISDIAKRSQLPRSSAYNVLMKMHERGIVKHYTKRNKMYFSALKPAELIEHLKQEQDKLGDHITTLKTYLPQFEALINPHLPLPKVSFHEGIKGVQDIYQDILKRTEEAGETKAWITLESIDEELKDWLYTKFTPKKVKKNIRSKVIVSSPKTDHYQKLDKKHLRETRSIPYDLFPFKVEIDLYAKNRIAIISFSQNELFGLIIESDNIFTTAESIFEFMWKNS